jgi:hypothetical protein
MHHTNPKHYSRQQSNNINKGYMLLRRTKLSKLLILSIENIKVFQIPKCSRTNYIKEENPSEIASI